MLVRKGDSVFFGERYIGKIRGRSFVTTRTEEHFFKKFDGFAVNEELLGVLRGYGVEELAIKYYGKTGKEVYRISRKKAEEDCQRVKFEGFEWQVIIPRDAFDEVRYYNNDNRKELTKRETFIREGDHKVW